MNYEKIYDHLITRARNRLLEGYTEKHHIIPRCMGGTDESDNIVSLTAEEHFLAHLLLVKIHPSNTSLWYAANMMGNRNNKHYGWVKKRHAENARNLRQGKTYEEIMGEETAIKTRDKKRTQGLENNPMLGRTHTTEARKKMSDAWKNRDPDTFSSYGRKGKKHSEHTKQKMKDAIQRRKEEDYEAFIEEQRRRASNPKKKKDGYFQPKSEGTKRKMAESARKRERYPCKYCGKMITKPNIRNHERTHE